MFIQKLGAALAAAAVFGALSTTAAAADWPGGKPITMIIPYAAGGFADTRMRMLGEELAKELKANVVIENKAGAGGVIGTAEIARAKPDGYTIGSGHLAPLSVNPTLMPKNVPYDVQKDLAPVILIEEAPLILNVNKKVPVSNVAELIALAKKDPGRITFGSSGVGGAHHLSGELFANSAGVEMTHVPYKGGAPAATDLMAGHIDMMFEMGYAAMPAIQADKVKPLGVTSNHRLPLLPDVPTVAEAGLPGFESYNWQGIVVPAGTPQDIIQKLNAAFNKILKKPEVIQAFDQTGGQVGGGTPEEFGKFIQDERAKWAKVIKEAKISVD
ncbi:tripartite-type tricarboxylate transporter receptor subunit TctC [Parapusillimonas granuli]|uniref:Tripartite tricarboxylate transporter substrate binding protein n=2 Tax=Parapusillimonas granuli TaxID=380911 RepID=A0A853FVC7_9BURK|nr:tripartite tricarboxylate transporter substrate binding protein [Parapusillimonas granuli]MBB5215378.1 tripartite-type tricarboxylate transporter receptor subunit TctC [Parapusillimonas granuli]MEB2400219.1 tripartite tricarboxylate transporter substrate binding protein [Alcaligenaceae bacterium]NYT49954.1 tripartite tricarboxylate transporter substrate binding protein [Parapusillimonas granuli]